MNLKIHICIYIFMYINVYIHYIQNNMYIYMYIYVYIYIFNNYKQNLVGSRLTPVLTSAIQVVPEDQSGNR